jgi:hypothetical protein
LTDLLIDSDLGLFFNFFFLTKKKNL